MDSSALASSIAALRSSIRALESRSDSLENWLYFWVTLVVVGVVLEVWFVIWEYRQELDEYRGGTIRSPQKPSGMRLAFELAGALLVAIGVSGELGVDVKAGRVQTELRTKNGELIQLLQGVSSAALSAASQNEREAWQLRKDSEGLKKTAEDERLARVKIEDAVAWRRLSKSQILEIGSKLAAFPRQLTALAYNVNDLEAYSFASDIDAALHQFAKWNIGEPQAIFKMREGPVNFGTNPPLERGVVVRSTPDERSRAAAKAVIEELSIRGFDTSPGEQSHNPKPAVEIFVEPRPEGPQGAAKLRSSGKSNP